MSLNWKWTDKMGTCKHKDGHEYNLYKGNAFMIAVYEDEQNKTYGVNWFACDEKHMKNLMGIEKNDSNLFEEYEITEFTLDTRYKETKKFINMAIDAKYKVTINLY